MANLDQCVRASLKSSWDEEFLSGTKNKNNCSGFVKSVALKLGVPLPATADADGIVAALKKNWKQLNSGVEAEQQARMGVLVLAGLKGADHSPARTHGHVAVVIAGDLYKKKYPLVWGGSIGGAQSQGDKSVGEVWNRSDRDNVEYFAYTTAVCKQ